MTIKSIIYIDFNSEGGISSLQYGGEEFAAPESGSGLFAFQMRDFTGNPLRLDRTDFQIVEQERKDGFFILQFSGCVKYPGTAVKVSATVKAAEIRWRIEVLPGTADFQIEWIDFPRLRLRRFPDGKFLLPFAEGTLIDSLAERERTADFRCEYAEYPMTGISGFYPGPVAMQFEAYYNGTAGLYFGCCDSTHSPKSIDVMTDGSDALRLLLQHFTGGKSAIGYDVVTAGFHGDWQSAAEIYRNWMETEDSYLPEKQDMQMSSWLADSPVLLIYPVKGSGLDTGGVTPNEYFPYCNALDVVARYHERWNSRIMALLMHWEGTAPWAPPYAWPPYGGEAELALFIDKMHKNNDLVGLYGSGIAWTQKSMIDPRYDRREQFNAQQIDKEICSGPRGETFSRVCNGNRGQRIGYDLCPAQEFTSKTVTAEISAANRLGIDYFQYFDQNQGGAAPLCYSREHHHPALPGAWLTESMRELFKKAEKAASSMVIGCENAAAEPYLESCRLNDLRNHLAWGTGGVPVPLYPFLFHEYTFGFSGNGVCLSNWVDLERTPFFLQWELAWNFANGNILSVVLKDGGKIHWHWALPWSVKEPAQQPLVKLIGNLTAWRRGRAAKYLVAGRMEKAPQLSCGTRTVYLRNRPPVQLPSVEAVAWSKNGKQAILLVNYDTEVEPCRIDFGRTRVGNIFSREDKYHFESASELLQIPPLNALLLEFTSESGINPIFQEI